MGKSTLAREILLDALLMAVLRRNPQQRVLIHSDQGTQFGSDDLRRFCREHNLEPSISLRGNCWDHAVVESFFSSLKKKRIRKRAYKTRDLTRPICSATSRSSKIKPVGTATSAVLAPKPLNRLHCEGPMCLRIGVSPPGFTTVCTPGQPSGFSHPGNCQGVDVLTEARNLSVANVPNMCVARGGVLACGAVHAFEHAK